MLDFRLLLGCWGPATVALAFFMSSKFRARRQNRMIAFPLFCIAFVIPVLYSRGDYMSGDLMIVIHYTIAAAAFHACVTIYIWFFHPSIQQITRWNTRTYRPWDVMIDFATLRPTGNWEWTEAMGKSRSDVFQMWLPRLGWTALAFGALFVMRLFCSAPPDFDNALPILSGKWFEKYAWSYGSGLCSYLSISAVSELILFGWSMIGNAHAKPFMGNPFCKAETLHELWSNEWHNGLKHSYKVVAFRPVFKTVQRITKNGHIAASAGAIAVFAMSGVMHEFCYFAAVGSVPGLHLLFFVANGLAMSVQDWFQPLPVLVPPIFNYSGLKLAQTHAFLLWAMPLFAEPLVRAGFHTL